MKNYLSKLSSANVMVIRQLGSLADEKKIHAYLVGGIVRDLILGKHDVDLDIVIEGDIASFASAASKILGGTLKVYKEFGTATIVLINGKWVDLARARKESYAKPGALPKVYKGTLKEDLFRRDFTINTLAIRINEENFGDLVDEFGGLKDLKRKKLRVLHEKSFIDDPTRILRAVRFASRFNFFVEPKTATLLKTALRKNVFQTISSARYFQEIKKALQEKDPMKCLKRLDSFKLLNFLQLKSPDFIERVKIVYFNLKKSRMLNVERIWFFYFLAMIESHAAPIKEKIVREFHLTKEEKDSVDALVNAPRLLKLLSRKSMSASEVYQLLEPFEGDFILYLKLRAKQKTVKRSIEHYLNVSRKVSLELNGHDLRRMGVSLGKEIGLLQRRLLMAKIDSRISDLQEEKQFAENLIKR